jgi:hypothetical protein
MLDPDEAGGLVAKLQGSAAEVLDAEKRQISRAGFHVQNPGTADMVVVNFPGHVTQRALGPDGIQMPEQHQRSILAPRGAKADFQRAAVSREAMDADAASQ